MNEQQIQQAYDKERQALDAANQHGMPTADYAKALTNLNAKHQAQLQQLQKQPDPFVKGLTGKLQPLPASPVTVSRDTNKLVNQIYWSSDLNARGKPIPLVQNTLSGQNEYDQQKLAIQTDHTLNSWDRDMRLEELDQQYGKTSAAPTAAQQMPTVAQAAATQPVATAAVQPVAGIGQPPAQKTVDPNVTKLQGLLDQVKQLDEQINTAGASMSMEGMLPVLQDKRNALLKQLGGSGAQGLDDYGYSGTLDPTRITDIKLDGKNIGNARYANGMATGNLEDVVSALGGKCTWDSLHSSADIRDADGRFVTSIKIINGQAFQVDMRGKPVKPVEMFGSTPQADIVSMGEMLGVPVSYYHDKNGVFHAYAQTDMRGAPVQVVRKED